MYTYDLLVYGLDITQSYTENKSKDESSLPFEAKLYINLVNDDPYYRKEYGDDIFEMTSIYHGDSFITPIYFGFAITDNDNNPDYLDTITNFDEEKYQKLFDTAIEDLKKHLKEEIEKGVKDGFEMTEDKELLELLENNELKPNLHTLEGSS